MQYVIVALALALAVWVMREPREAVPAGWLFMLAAMILLPSEARLRFIDDRYDEVWQMYFWAAGSLVIVLASVYRIGMSALWRVPWSMKAFVCVAVISSIYGFSIKAQPSYVVRQLYGALLFFLYFAIAQAVGDEEILFQRLKTIGLILAFALLVYYASVFSQFGFHKEDTSVTTQFGFLATFLFVKGYIEKRVNWFFSSAVILGASLLFFMRHVFLTFLFALALAIAVQSVSRVRKILCFGVAAMILLPSIFPPGAQFVVDTVEHNFPALFDVLPAGTADATSLMSRNVELVAGGAVLLQSPVLGAGMGSELSWDDPGRGFVEQAFVDNGWAYLMVKMGLVGILVFIWVLFTILRCVSRASLAVSICLIAILAVAMFSEPICFQFTTSPIAGALAGLLYARKYPRVNSSHSVLATQPAPEAA
jgi:hypothetical protein